MPKIEIVMESAEVHSALCGREIQAGARRKPEPCFEFQGGFPDNGAEMYACVARCGKAYVALIIDTVSLASESLLMIEIVKGRFKSGSSAVNISPTYKKGNINIRLCESAAAQIGLRAAIMRT